MIIELNCAACGNNRFDYPEQDEDQVLCQSCGESLGTFAAVKERTAEEVIARRKR
jgi:ribosomal protein S27E